MNGKALGQDAKEPRRQMKILVTGAHGFLGAALTRALLARGDSVKLSSFGSFLVRDKGQRVGRNPKTGVEVPIEPRRVMVFKPSNIMKARVNGEAVPDSD